MGPGPAKQACCASSREASAGEDAHPRPSVDSREHRDALAARRGHPDGPHILPDDDGVDSMSQVDPYTLATLLSDFKARQNRTEPPPRKSLFDWSWNMPLLLSILGVAAAQLVGYTQLGDRVESFGRRLELVERRQTDDIPRLDVQIQNNKLQDQRIQNMVEVGSETRRNVSDLAKIVAEQARSIGDMHESITLMRDRQDRGPH